jgi:predicted nucleic acid-binding protein
MLFDTTFLIDYEREVKRSRPGAAHAFLVQHPNAPLYTSIISVGEFGEGFGPAQQQDCRSCLQHYTVLNLDRDIAWVASQIARQFRSSGPTIGENDVWIAATALHHNLALITNNAADGLPERAESVQRRFYKGRD